MTKINLFSDGETVDLIKYWIKYNDKLARDPDFDGGEEYYMGIVQGLEFALHILERTGD